MGTTTPVWNGIVLAGGRSSRMGRDKAMLPWRGHTLLDHMRGRLREAGAARVVISGAYPDPDAIPDEIGDGGPAAALAQLAPKLDDGVWLLVPVDMPLLDTALLDTLAAMADEAASRRSLRAIHEALEGGVIAVDGWRSRLINCNTPAEWDTLIADTDD